MKKAAVISLLLCANITLAHSAAPRDTSVPAQYADVHFSKLLHRFGKNIISSFTCNYGLNYAVTPLITYGMIKSGIDWQWNRMAYHNKWVAYSGIPFGVMGFAVPAAVPLWLYIYGRRHEDIKLQVTGLALGQSAILALGISFGIKSLTGRRDPAIMPHHVYPDKYSETIDYSGDWAFGFMRRGVMSGWPSSHTIVAFSMAATMAELYPDNAQIKWGAYIYAAAVGLSVSLFSHWASEVVSGALIGCAVGKSVGRSFNQLLGGGRQSGVKYSLYPTMNGVGVAINF